MAWASGKDDVIWGWVFGRFLSDRPLTHKDLELLESTNSVTAIRDPDGGAVFGLFLLLILMVVAAVATRRNRKKRRKFRDLASDAGLRGRRCAGSEEEHQEWEGQQQALQDQFNELRRSVAERIKTQFLVKACPRCHEFQNRLIQISPNARSVQLQCTTCRRKYWAGASHPAGYKVAKEYQAFLEAAQKLLLRFFRDEDAEIEILVNAPAGRMPFEQTTREPIPSILRSEIWRRDKGRCVKCGSKNNLQFDHIIPVSKGGATTAENLQLLCRSCNLRKGNRI